MRVISTSYFILLVFIGYILYIAKSVPNYKEKGVHLTTDPFVTKPKNKK